MNMTVRETLERPKELRLEIARRERRIEDLRSQAARVTAILNKNRVVFTKDPTLLQEILAEAADLENEVLALEEELYRTCREIRRALAAMEDKTLADVLELRYVDGLAWNEIAKRMCFTVSWLYKLHIRALEAAGTVGMSGLGSCSEGDPSTAVGMTHGGYGPA